MFCGQCGTKATEGAKFCSSCGKGLDNPSLYQGVLEPNPIPLDNDYIKKKNINKKIGIIVCVLVIFLISSIIFFSLSNNDNLDIRLIGKWEILHEPEYSFELYRDGNGVIVIWDYIVESFTWETRNNERFRFIYNEQKPLPWAQYEINGNQWIITGLFDYTVTFNRVN